MIRSLFIIFLCLSCMERKTAVGSWKSPLNDRDLKIDEKAMLVDHSHGCTYEALIKGGKQEGTLTFEQQKNCHNPRAPKNLVYKVSRRSLQVCTDYYNGDHTCEKFQHPQ